MLVFEKCYMQGVYYYYFFFSTARPKTITASWVLGGFHRSPVPHTSAVPRCTAALRPWRVGRTRLPAPAWPRRVFTSRSGSAASRPTWWRTSRPPATTSIPTLRTPKRYTWCYTACAWSLHAWAVDLFQHTFCRFGWRFSLYLRVKRFRSRACVWDSRVDESKSEGWGKRGEERFGLFVSTFRKLRRRFCCFSSPSYSKIWLISSVDPWVVLGQILGNIRRDHRAKSSVSNHGGNLHNGDIHCTTGADTSKYWNV